MRVFVRSMFLLLFFIGGSAMMIGVSEPLTLREQENATRKIAPLTYADIYPLLKKKCGKCHGDDPDGDLQLLTYPDLMRGGEHGSAVVPGKPEKSPLYTKLFDKPPFGKKMPKRGTPMTDEEIELIKKWILDGAKK